VNNRNTFLALIGWLLVTFLAAAAGAPFPPGEWYASLNKPSWNPPGWIFGPVWTTLYTLMAIAAWLVWKRGGFSAQRRPLSLYLAQLVLNAAWTPLFFGLQKPWIAAGEMVLLWIAIVLTMIAFFRVHRVAGLLFIPYILWVSFALVLNTTLARLNPGA
jgi:benzodiazapine receptor